MQPAIQRPLQFTGIAARAEDFTEPEELRRSSFLLLSSVLVLLAFGIVMVYSASAVESAELRDASPFRPLLSHSVKVAVGLALMAGAASLDVRTIFRLATPFYVATLALLALVLVPGIGERVNGSSRWLATAGIFGFALQPSELAKLGLVLWLAAWIAKIDSQGDVGASFRATFLPAAGAILLPGALILMETDFGTFLLITALGLLLLLVAGARLGHLFALGLLAIPPALLVLRALPRTRYVFDRIAAFVGHHADPTAAAASGGLTQVDFAESALRVGGLSGVGLGAGRHKLFFLPESDNDFIVSVIGEELGFIGTTALIGLFVLLLWSGSRVLLGIRHRFGFVVVAGVLVTIAMQALMNLFVAVRWAPVKGIPLPFVSSGGSSLTALCLGIGLLLAIARQPDFDPAEGMQRGLRKEGEFAP